MKNKEKIKLVLLIFILPMFLISIISTYAVTGLLSSEVSYDRSTSKLRSNNVQDAIDELNNKYKNADDLQCPVGKKCTKVYTLTINPNGGSYNGSTSSTKITRKEGEKYTILTPTKEGYTFTGWTFSGTQNGTKSGSTYTFGAGNDIIVANYEKVYKCKRATTLHTATCQSSSGYGCRAAGVSSGGTITYGQLGTSGTLTSGDAFDCDVNGDGTYDSETERFYYVSDYYDTSSKEFNTDVATLIYYSNVSNGSPNNTSAYAYYGTSSSYNNYSGPQKTLGYAYYPLPSTSQWSNISLYKSTRAILNEQGGNTTGGGSYTITSEYDYGDKAARFLTTQELGSACNITVGRIATGELNTCKYLMENTRYDNSSSSYTYGYWLETPYASNSRLVWFVEGADRCVDNTLAYDGSIYGARPAIEILKTDILY